MAVSLVVLKESGGETRVAATPETVKKLTALGVNVTIESDAGAHSGFTDASFEAEGASIAADIQASVKQADIVFGVKAPSADTVGAMKKDALLVAQLNPYQSEDAVKAYAQQGIQAMAMELMPRITRAQ